MSKATFTFCPHFARGFDLPTASPRGRLRVFHRLVPLGRVDELSDKFMCAAQVARQAQCAPPVKRMAPSFAMAFWGSHLFRRTMDRQLHRLYAENKKPVAFIDESYELRAGETFYILATALVYPEYLSHTRLALLDAYGNEAIHAAPMFARMEFGSLRKAIELSSTHHDGMDVIVQAPVAEGDPRGEGARRRCLEFVVPLLHREEAVTLFVLDSRNSPVANRKDSFVFQDLRQSGEVGRNVKEHHAFPSVEPLLGLTDLLAWSFRQRLTGRDNSWFDLLRGHTRVHEIG